MIRIRVEVTTLKNKYKVDYVMWWILYLISVILSYGIGLYQMKNGDWFDGDFEDFLAVIILPLLGPFSLLIWILFFLNREDTGFD